MSELQGNIFGTRIMCLHHCQKKENAFYGNYDGTDDMSLTVFKNRYKVI